MTRAKARIPERREAAIEAAACAKIQERWPQVQIRKLSGPSDRHWPDRVLFFRHDLVVFIEFKRPGEELTPGQRHKIAQLEELGFKCLLGCDTEDTVAQLGNFLWEQHYDS